jgi:hypothetical protein
MDFFSIIRNLKKIIRYYSKKCVNSKKNTFEKIKIIRYEFHSKANL